MSKTKYIVVTGGVCSGLGKGTAAASIGALLKSGGFKVFPVKLDPYLNVDPGTMNPFQHGEVFVTDDGAETDLDLGHYERFIDENASKFSNATTGQIYQQVLKDERRGDFLGKTIQIVPHITNAIKTRIRAAAQESAADFILIEIGGTVGDIEGEPYLEAVRQFHHEEGHENVMFIHLTLLPYLKVTHELKTKPTQASVRELLHRGIQPDMILARADYPIKKEMIDKIALFCDVKEEAVIPAPTVRSIYEIPLNFHKYNITDTIFNHFGLRPKKLNIRPWQNLVKKIKNGLRPVTIGMVGKYTDHGDAYLSVNEALRAAGYAANAKVEIVHIDSERLEKREALSWKRLKQVDGILVPGGFGKRGIEGKIAAARYARENRIPYFGLCLGMQIATIEFARGVLGDNSVSSQEFDEKAKHQVIHSMPDQEKKLLEREYGASMRLGSWSCKLKPGSKVARAYAEARIEERHRHRYEFNNVYREQLEKAGLTIVGTSPDGHIVEIVELENHPWFVGVQFHPEFKSRPLRPHPLFRAFIEACLKR
ncbi:MAG: CTP synthase [Parcubacteria group bacterium]|nr:CTP synthase [Parcubacteria group bacterium]